MLSPLDHRDLLALVLGRLPASFCTPHRVNLISLCFSGMEWNTSLQKQLEWIGLNGISLLICIVKKLSRVRVSKEMVFIGNPD